MKSNILLIVLSVLLIFAMVSVSMTYAVDVFDEDELPFGKSYEEWVEDWWNWNAAIPGDPDTSFAGLVENGCMINKDGPVVMMLDPAVGGTHYQICEISPSQGILIPGWASVCSTATKGNTNYKSFKEFSECARKYNLGTVTVDVSVDNKSIARVEAEDYKTISLINATELYTKIFNVTSPEDSNLEVDYPGTHPGVAHGWYIFLKPLPVGEHTVYYKNDVRETPSGVGNINNAEIIYFLKVR